MTWLVVKLEDLDHIWGGGDNPYEQGDWCKNIEF